jgi:branched-chain amino acid transport system ATP-binding protein
MSSLRIRGVTKRFGGVVAIEALSLSVSSGCVLGLVGPNGAGKTTAINVITGMLRPDAGTLVLDDRELTHAPPDRIARAGIARTFQNIRLVEGESVLKNALFGFYQHETTSLLSNLLNLPPARRELRDLEHRALALLDRLDMRLVADQRAGELPYGFQRRLEIARAMATNPKVLLLDEPVAGMNDVEAAGLGRIFREIAAGGVAVLVVEHNVGFVTATCDEVVVLDSGRLLAEGKPQDVFNDPQVINAYLG